MAGIDRKRVVEALKQVPHPDQGQDLVSLRRVRDFSVDSDRVTLRLLAGEETSAVRDLMQRDVEKALRDAGAEEVSVEIQEASSQPAQGERDGAGRGGSGRSRLPGVGSIVAVGSGKGGVGKSTVAVNVAVSLARQGARVGLLDADIYGPSLPLMLGLADAKPQGTPDGKGLIPLEQHGLKVMSMGFMLQRDDAVAWRGPMLGKALQQFVDDVEWGELDHLIVDMPPGTGDVALSLAQLLPVTGALVVTTPQDVAFSDVRRAIKMFELTKTKPLGLVENMTHFVCDECGTPHHIFGESHIGEYAEEAGLDVLGRLPLDGMTTRAADAGKPITVAQPDSEPARAYHDLAERLRAAIGGEAEQEPASRFKSFFQMKRE